MSEETTDPAGESSEPAAEQVAAPAVQETHAKRALDALLEKEAMVTRAAQEQKAMAEKLAKWQRLESLSPVEAAAELGVDLQSFQQHAIANYDPNKAITEKMTALEARIAQRDEKEAAERRAAAIQEAQENVRTYVDSSDGYPLTKSMGMQALVFDTIQQARQSNQHLSEEEAASKVEKSLSKMLEKAMANEDVRKRFDKAQAEAAEQPAVVLSNDSSSAPSGSRPKRQLTEQERLASFISLLDYKE